jgi:hypothetical protein
MRARRAQLGSRQSWLPPTRGRRGAIGCFAGLFSAKSSLPRHEVGGGGRSACISAFWLRPSGRVKVSSQTVVANRRLHAIQLPKFEGAIRGRGAWTDRPGGSRLRQRTPSGPVFVHGCRIRCSSSSRHLITLSCRWRTGRRARSCVLISRLRHSIVWSGNGLRIVSPYFGVEFLGHADVDDGPRDRIAT